MAVGYLALVMLGVVLGLGLLEIGLRAFAPVLLYSLTEKTVVVSTNPTLLYENNPDHPEHNRQGQRYPMDFTPEHMPLVAVVGDSVVYGWGVPPEQMLTEYMESYLTRFEAWPFAVPGYSILQETEMLRVQVLPYKPDVVVLVLCLNDWSAYSKGLLQPMLERSPILRDFLDPESSRWERLLLHSQIYRRWRAPRVPKMEGDGPIHDHWNHQMGWFTDHLREFQRLTRAAGAKLIVTLAPIAGPNEVEYRRRLAHVEQSCNCKAVDLWPLKEALGDDRMFLPHDPWHLTGEGARVIALRLVDEVKRVAPGGAAGPRPR